MPATVGVRNSLRRLHTAYPVDWVEITLTRSERVQDAKCGIAIYVVYGMVVQL